MKRFIAVLLAAVLTLGIGTSFAGPSVSDIKVTLAEDAEIITSIELPEDLEIILSEVNYDNYKQDTIEVPDLKVNDIIEVISSVNDPRKTTMSVKNAAAKLKADKKSGRATVITVYGAEEKGIPEDLSNSSFVSKFMDINLSDGSYTVDGVEVSLKVTLIPECLKGVEKESISDYMIILINPETGETVFLELYPENFDGEKLTVEFPFLGTFAFIQK